MAINYFPTGLIYYLAKAGQKAGLEINLHPKVGGSVPPVVVLVWTGIWRGRRAAARDAAAHPRRLSGGIDPIA